MSNLLFLFDRQFKFSIHKALSRSCIFDWQLRQGTFLCAKSTLPSLFGEYIIYLDVLILCEALSTYLGCGPERRRLASSFSGST